MAKTLKSDRSEKGAERQREDEVLRRMLNTPPKPHKRQKPSIKKNEKNK